jgi:predicted transcriptional regulator
MVEKTKARMIAELKSEFLRKQGSEKARWVSNKLRKSSKDDVEEQYRRLKGNITQTKKTLSPIKSVRRKTVIIGARNGRMFSQPI